MVSLITSRDAKLAHDIKSALRGGRELPGLADEKSRKHHNENMLKELLK